MNGEASHFLEYQNALYKRYSTIGDQSFLLKLFTGACRTGSNFADSFKWQLDSLSGEQIIQLIEFFKEGKKLKYTNKEEVGFDPLSERTQYFVSQLGLGDLDDQNRIYSAIESIKNKYYFKIKEHQDKVEESYRRSAEIANKKFKAATMNLTFNEVKERFEKYKIALTKWVGGTMLFKKPTLEKFGLTTECLSAMNMADEYDKFILKSYELALKYYRTSRIKIGHYPMANDFEFISEEKASEELPYLYDRVEEFVDYSKGHKL